ncbi:peptidase [Dissulfurispira thermophila]|uniref:Probable periplasmic serine endoprotease DegP-like n=1 Tax=Dissulfurispira thermophila TaxID=2715679 RepID=A0A7G1H0P8_9BACT|nr:DegQ family serine endoprotease [Dissulfurispira thermophila]BCB95713.1 peptidase [Dissulfurispira thermophila]
MRKNLATFVMVAVLAVIVGIFIGSQAGCENKSKSELIGFPQSFADLAEKTKPAVVNISTEKTIRIPGSPFRHFFGPDEPFGDFFRRFFDEDIPDRELKQQSLGSGFIIDKDGYIITNNHVVEGADEIKVKLADGREFKAKVIGRDPKTDLALIKITTVFKNLPVLPLGDSDKVRVGDWVLAIGNPFGLEHTVTQGIISATGRVIGSGPYDNFLQTDAPINPGNSGGPLINLKGEVIGINTAIIASGQGIGFAIPSNMAKSVVSQLKEKGKVVRGWIGVSVQTVTPDIAQSFGLKESKGALVGDVVSGSPAEKAGIERGDVIIAFNGKDIKQMSDLPRLVAEVPVGKTVDIRVIRDGKEIDLKITVAELTEEKLMAQMPVSDESLGMRVDDITAKWARQFRIKDKSGVLVIDVLSGSLADMSGIRPGDVIKEINRKPVRNLNDYEVAMKRVTKGGSVLLLIKRGGQTFYASIKIP